MTQAKIHAWITPVAGWVAQHSAYLWIGLIATIVLGITVGFTRKITVFRDFDDLGIVFLMCVVPPVWNLAAAFIQPTGHANTLYIAMLVVIETALLLLTIVRTFRDNPNPVSFVLALLTKIPLSVIFVFAVMQLINPSGQTGEARGRQRRVAAQILLVVTPIILALVREKKGLVNPARIRALSYR